ncbi:MAG: thioredoxin family protein [Streptococcaceae bacterium]|nr:thioredoxin family protein [Streptococcaceae bacterium]
MIKPKDYEELEKYVKVGKNIFFFTADWCGDCRFIKPKISEIESKHTEYIFIEVNRDQFLDLAIKWEILGIPSFVVIENGKEIGRYVDKFHKTKEQIDSFIENL